MFPIYIQPNVKYLVFNLANERSQMKTFAPTLGCTFELTLDYYMYLQILSSDQNEKSAECLICTQPPLSFSICSQISVMWPPNFSNKYSQMSNIWLFNLSAECLICTGTTQCQQLGMEKGLEHLAGKKRRAGTLFLKVLKWHKIYLLIVNQVCR